MCGICGLVSDNGADEAVLRRMADVIAHRGPDDEGFFVDGDVGLGMRRLSIIDVRGGHQPIANEDGSVQLVLNGEVYNYRQLARGLSERGHTFRTEADTEVIVHLWEEDGPRCVERLEGMFAFALWDRRRRALFLARDRLGQKPLFYARRGGTFAFGSEVKSLLRVPGFDASLDVRSLHHYLSLRFVPSPHTMFEGVRKLPPGHTLLFEGGEVKVEPYWRLSFKEDKLDLPEDDLLELLREALSEAVGSHLVSDVEVGAMLSGGLDSSIVVALASKAAGPLKTFAIGVQGDHQDVASFNELPFAREVARHCGAECVEETVRPDLVKLLPRIIHHMDEPCDPIAACMFHASRLASRHVKVTLGGDGGDELFAGFDRYVGMGRVARLAPLLALGRLPLKALLAAVPESFAYKSWTQKARWVERMAAVKDPGERYAEATCFFRFTHDEKARLFGDRLWRDLRGLPSTAAIAEAYRDAPASDPVDRMLYADVVTRLPEHSLMLSDRMSMAHGLEMRSPLLDHRLVELLARFPAAMKIRRGTLKYALRRVAEGELPASIVRRPKQGFMFPVAHWFQGELHGVVRGLFESSRAIAEGIFKQDEVMRLLDEHRRKVVDHHVRLWLLLTFELWYRLYVEGSTVADLQADLEARLSRSP